MKKKLYPYFLSSFNNDEQRQENFVQLERFMLAFQYFFQATNWCIQSIVFSIYVSKNSPKRCTLIRNRRWSEAAHERRQQLKSDKQMAARERWVVAVRIGCGLFKRALKMFDARYTGDAIPLKSGPSYAICCRRQNGS